MIFEYRCGTCDKLLLKNLSFDTGVNFMLEMVCPRCKSKNFISFSSRVEVVTVNI